MPRRSIIIDGAVTSISMEDGFWEELDRAAQQRQMSWANYVRQLLKSLPPSSLNRSASIREALLLGVRAETENWCTESPARWNIRDGGANSVRDLQTVSPRMVFGRGDDCDIRTTDPEASRRHCLLVNDGLEWWVLDLDSKNGISVGGVRTQAARMGLGTRVIAGRSTIVRVE